MGQMVPVVLCGGSGTRLWPKSRATKPKPFIPLVGEEPLFLATLNRCGDTDMFADPIVVTGAAHLGHVEDLLPGEGGSVIVEPMARNTAAAIALAACRLPEDAVMLVCPSDHHIADCDAFTAAASRAADLASDGWLVAFGITPDAPETGFGYLKQGKAIADGSWAIERFVEKPDLAKAQAFLDEGGYSWNGGLFAFRAGTFMDELTAHRPAIAAAVRKAVAAGHEDGRRFYPEAKAFAEIESESVDYAVMENTAKAAMVPVSMGWSDIGNWSALHAALDRDDAGNTARGRVELVDCRNVMVDTDGPRVSVIGLENVVVVVDGDDVLVTTADGAQKVGKLQGAANQ
ncbi:mannose-1-phosphate guanylyltransferase [Croceicoccus naphthovorans]|uniref:Mannose-1-phosphate guanylyltransferase n=1 Tax=Croceicoccus naphthovorans TaxID=1348774 RepID=A0A0G3XFZ8_9SPHN|nr:sugar phosphate nucleotidyltransferase [Croceicoccus naphthovorans]AKM09541.1 mannose-1-phosphate guanylyltransferase [Croceicoccus naphthovorans]MBB3989706.1 mannose-1-phosphate guanylyltransferase/mannose-1-phosphate guanylyltransferase/mannose-6-phosphate isomerase [Croceicoccus naphthovorans]